MSTDPLAVILPLAMLGFVGGTVLLVLFISFRADSKLHRGVSMLRRRAARKTGMRAQAKVIDVQYETILGANDMILEVQGADGRPYRVEVAERVELDQNKYALAGMMVAVFVDRQDPRLVVLDLDDLDRKAKQKNIDANERHDRLMRGD